MKLEDRIGGKVQIEMYTGHDFELNDWHIDQVLDDILMVQYVDINEDGTLVKRGHMWVPIDATKFVWRVAKVILAGPSCTLVKPGDFVSFPNDKGIQAREINGLQNICFLNESRIFGTCSPRPQKTEK